MIHQFLPEIGKSRQQLAFAPIECQQGCFMQVKAPRANLENLLAMYESRGFITPNSAPTFEAMQGSPDSVILRVDLACPGRFGRPINCLRKTLGDLDDGLNFPLCVNQMR